MNRTRSRATTEGTAPCCWLPKRNDETIVVPALRIPHDLDRINGPHSITEFHLVYGGDLESKPSANRALMFARYHGLKDIASDRQTDWKKWGE